MTFNRSGSPPEVGTARSGTDLTAVSVFEATFTRAVIAAIALLAILIALKSDKVRDGGKVLLGIVAGLVAIVAAYAIGYAVGFSSGSGTEAVGAP